MMAIRDTEYQPTGMLRGALRIVGSAAAAFAVVGLLSLASMAFRSERDAVNKIDVSKISQVAIRSSNSDLKIVEGKGDQLIIKARVTDGLTSTTYELHRVDNQIEIVGRCVKWLSPGCGVKATVEVPKDYPLLIATGSADVRAEGLKDRVVTIGTGSGNVVGHKLAVQEFSVDSDDGDVSTTFARQPYALKVTTKDGDITATIPAGKIRYLVNVHSTEGKVSSNLVDRPNGRGIIRLLSDSGDITVH
ncbi:MAG: DUF4097 family beta strand repeat-containing protein [Aeromicrobium sp.]